jgi:asparagine synthase (glutamine-hydrolysing)
LLSGGIDSATVVSRMAALAVNPLSTFSVAFEDPSYDESAHAETVATHFGADHHAAGLVPRAVELVDRLLPFMDDPIGDFSIFPTYLVSRLARQKVKVVLSGDGGDEVFGGYDTYLAERLARWLTWVPAACGRAAFHASRRMSPRAEKKGAWNLLRRFLEGMGHPAAFGHMRWMMFLGASEKAQAYGPALRDALGKSGFEMESIVAAALGGTPIADPIERSLRLDLGLYLPENILLKVDRMSMATSLEARVPLLDHRLVEYVARLPTRYKIRGFRRKWILRRAVRDWVPPSVLARRKSGFSIPMKTWLRTDLRHLIEQLEHGAIVRDRGLIEADYVRRLVREHLEGRADHAHRLWAMAMLEWWVRNVLEVKADAGPGRRESEATTEGGVSRHGS